MYFSCGVSPGRLPLGFFKLARWHARLLITVLALVPFTAQFCLAVERFEGRPKLHDGLNSSEEQRAMQALRAEIVESRLESRSESQVTASRIASSVGQSSHPDVPDEPQLLLMERRHDKASSQRLADAWYYGYLYNETIHKTVDLASGQVLSSEVIIGTQLPLIDSEIARAFDVLLASAPDRRALEAAYFAVTGREFLDRSQVSYKAFVFHPDTVVDGLTADARRCGINRCAQMLIYTHDNIALNTSPVVDLSSARVLQNLELRAQAIVRREEAAL